MEEQVGRLTEKTWSEQPPLRSRPRRLTPPRERFLSTPPSSRLLIGISGIPGSGKTTLARAIASRLNALSPTPIAVSVPMDGFHLTRAQLSAMPDPADAHFRRGAAFTFDGEAFLALVRAVRAPLTPSTRAVLAPSFDHAAKDPVADDVAVPPAARVVVFEGNYLSLGRGPWREAAGLMDELWFVEVDFERARERLWRRHLRAGIVGSREEGIERAEKLDLVNGREIVDGRLEVDEVIVSREDDDWRGEEWEVDGLRDGEAREERFEEILEFS
jgi:pantothenate kinase